MEKGLLPISEEILNAISKKLDYPLSFFSKATIRIPLGTFHYRKRITMGQKKLSILEARLDILSNIIDELLESITINEFDIPHLEVTEKRNAAEIAYKLREFFNVGSAPIENIVKLLEKHGVIVVFFKIDNEKFDGVTRITQKSQPVIFLNSQMPNDRKRFTIAHELGHLVMHLRTSLENEVEDDVKEMQANQFANNAVRRKNSNSFDTNLTTYGRSPSHRRWLFQTFSASRRHPDSVFPDRIYQ